MSEFKSIESPAAVERAAPCSAFMHLDAAMIGMTIAQRARLLDRTLAAMSHYHRNAQSGRVRTTLEILLFQMTIDAQALNTPTDQAHRQPPTAGGERKENQ